MKRSGRRMINAHLSNAVGLGMAARDVAVKAIIEVAKVAAVDVAVVAVDVVETARGVTVLTVSTVRPGVVMGTVRARDVDNTLRKADATAMVIAPRVRTVVGLVSELTGSVIPAADRS